MKVSLPRVFVQTVFVLGVMGAAYQMGRWQRAAQAKSIAAPIKSSRNDPGVAARAKLETEYREWKKDQDARKEKATFGIVLAKDPQRGLAELAKHPPGSDTETAYRNDFSDWAEDPKLAPDAAAAALALPVGLERTAALKGVARGWAQSDAKAALDWAAGLPTEDSATFKQVLTDVATENNDSQKPPLAAQYVDQLTDAAARNDIIAQIGKAWGTLDGIENQTAALAWLDQVATGDNYDQTVKGIFDQLGQRDPAAAAALIAQVAEPGARDAAIASVAKNWGSKDPQSALAWAQTLPDTDQIARGNALISITKAWAGSDPVAAAAYVQSSPDPSSYLPVAPVIAQDWADFDPASALAFTNSLPDGDLKNQALNDALVSIATADFSTAWNYAAALPASASTDAIISNLIGNLAKRNIAQASGFVGQIPTETARTGAINSLSTAWGPRDPKAFSTWVSNLPSVDERNAAVAGALKAVQTIKNESQEEQLTAGERAALAQIIIEATGGGAP